LDCNKTIIRNIEWWNKRISKIFKGNKNIYSRFTNKLLLFHKVKIDNGVKLEKYAEEKLTDEHVELLKKYVPTK